MCDIVYVDDEPDALLALATEEQLKRIQTLKFDPTPDAEPLAAPSSEKVWLFDFFLVAPAPGNDTDENGLSLFQKWKVTACGRPTTALVSSDLERAVGQSPGPVERHHIVAQRHGVEWVGDKSDETLRRIVTLADAATKIGIGLKPTVERHGAGVYEIEQLVFDVLGVPREAEWARSAERQIDRARPPRAVLGTSSSAVARKVIAWLLTHVLPYPSFLLTDAQAALRLQIDAKSFREVADRIGSFTADELAGSFDASLYDGPLAGFLGRRWWRAAIDDFAWHISEAGEDYRSRFQEFAGEIALKWLDQPEPVLLSNADLIETDETADASECVRVTDEDFPADVDAAWVRIDEAIGDRLLAAKVVFEDRELLSPAA